MKKIPILLLTLSACFFMEPVESSISKKSVELTGNGYQAFSLGGNVKLMMVENPDKDPSVPASLSKRFRDYIENQEDEIKDKY